MSLLPVFVQPPRARHDTPRTPAEDRRTPLAHRDAFAGSLATAMRKPVASLPAVPDSDAVNHAAGDAVSDATRPTTNALLAPTPRPDATPTPDVAVAPDAMEASEVAVCAPDATEHWIDGPLLLSSMEPTRVALTPATPPAVERVDENADTWCATDDEAPADADAADTAAAQLIAAMPFAPVSLPAAPLPVDAPAQEREEGASVAVSFTARSLPAIPPSLDAVALVEDHFDASAEALAATGIGAEGMSAARTGRDVPITTRGDAAQPAVAVTSVGAGVGAGVGTGVGTGVGAGVGAGVVDTAVTSPITNPVTNPVTSALTGAAGGASTVVERDLSRLDPAFRERLERVMERMRNEFGHEVRVVETVRTQARQNALFAQGRTAPGTVVTWTRNSRHLKGLAADLQVDGAWQNPLGYARLADIAKQEGLRTLGARDPGHLELPTDATVSSETLGTLLGDLQGEAGDAARRLRADLTQEQPHDADSRANRMAQVANVAQVARVATVASVARVAEVARPGAGRAAAATTDAASQLAVTQSLPPAGATDLAGAMRVVTPSTSVNMADRITQLMDLQATQAAKPLNSVLLRMENATGADDQIRIDTRGASVEARLGLGNAQQAAALTDRLGELREALERRGLTADSVRVQAASGSRSADSATFSRSPAPVLEMAAMRAMSDSQAQGNLRDQSARDQSARDQQQRDALAREQARHTPRSSSDEPRHRSRREQPEDRR